MSPVFVIYFEVIAVSILLGWSLYIVQRVGQTYCLPIVTGAVGGYFSAYAAREWHWPFALALVCALVLAAFIAFIFGLKLSKVEGFVTTIITIAFIFITQAVIGSMNSLGDNVGFMGIPRVEHLLPISYVVVVVVGFLIYRLDHSRIGRAMEVILVSPDVAASMGIDVAQYRLLLQTAAGVLGALAGVLLAFDIRAITIQSFGFSQLLAAFVVLFLGGCTTMWGVVLFAPIIWYLGLFLPGSMAAWHDVIYAVILIAIMSLRPDGIIDKKLLRAVRVISQKFKTRRKVKLTPFTP